MKVLLSAVNFRSDNKTFGEQKHLNYEQNYNQRGNCVEIQTNHMFNFVFPQQTASAEVNSRPVYRALGYPTLLIVLARQVYKRTVGVMLPARTGAGRDCK